MARYCEICKTEIDPERAENLPDTKLCGEHSEQIAEFGGEFRRISSQERTSKPGSLKLNYGGVTSEKVRNVEAMEKLRKKFDDENSRP